MPGSFMTALRRGGIVLGCAVLASVALAPAAQAHDDPDRRAKAIAAGWINTRLGDGLLHAAYDGGSGPVGYVDYGATVEAGFALDAVDRPRLLPRITAALEDSVDAYITGGSDTELYAGPTGKLLAYVSELGGDAADPASFGGTNLIARMEALTTASGRIEDVSSFGDYGNIFGQIWAVRGLLNVASAEAPAALDFLLSQQCDDGHFTTYFDDSCAAEDAGPDAAALAVIILSPYAGSMPTLATALDEAVDFLIGFQSRNGSFTDDNGVANANSTGLGGWAVGIGERGQAAKKAAVWLRSLQVPGRGCDGKLRQQRGAIAYSKAAYRDGVEDGITALTAGEWQTVAAQAAPALAHAPSTHVKLAVDAPERVDVGSRIRVRVDGLAQGERACVGIGRRLVPAIGAREGDPVFVRLTVRSPKGARAVKVLTSNAEASDRIVVR